MEITIIETSAYLELKRQLSMLSVQLGDFQRKVSPDRGLIPYSNIGGKCFYKEADIRQILEEGLIKKRRK